jgi:hypothetical protein
MDPAIEDAVLKLVLYCTLDQRTRLMHRSQGNMAYDPLWSGNDGRGRQNGELPEGWTSRQKCSLFGYAHLYGKQETVG